MENIPNKILVNVDKDSGGSFKIGLSLTDRIGYQQNYTYFELPYHGVFLHSNKFFPNCFGELSIEEAKRLRDFLIDILK